MSEREIQENAISGITRTSESIDLDRYDIAILGELQRDGRLSNAELATRIGLSAAPSADAADALAVAICHANQFRITK